MTVCRTGVRRGVGRGIGLGVAGMLLGQAALVAGVAAGTARAAEPAVTACGVDASKVSPPLLNVTLKKLKKVYYVGGSWSRFKLRATNRVDGPCSKVLPVVVFGAQGKGLHKGDVRLQWRAAGSTDGKRGKGGKAGKGGWQKSSVLAEEGTLVALAGPQKGLTLPANGRVTLPLRMKFARSAPTGRWVTLVIGFAPVNLDGEVLPLPLGVSDPHLFLVERSLVERSRVQHSRMERRRVERRRKPVDRRPQLAQTGGSSGTLAAGGVASAAVGGGAGLLVLARRRPGLRR